MPKNIPFEHKNITRMYFTQNDLLKVSRKKNTPPLVRFLNTSKTFEILKHPNLG